MMRLFRIILLSITFFIVCVHSGTAQTVDKTKIIIYYFSDESPSKNYRYFSYIIPDSLSAELENKEYYDITVLPVTFKYMAPETTAEERVNTISIITSRGKEVNAHFAVIGSYTVVNNVIRIQTQICTIETGEIFDAAELEEKIGALIYEIIEKITLKINTDLQKTIEIEKEKLAVSPYRQLYSAFQDVIMGFSYSTVFFTKEWENLYNNPNMSTLYIGIPFKALMTTDIKILNQMYIAPSWRFFSTNNHNKNNGSPNSSYLTCNMGSISLQHYFPVSEMMHIMSAIDIGMAYSELNITLTGGGGGPFDPTVDAHSTDLFVAGGINAIFYVYNIGITGGLHYNRIFYQGVDLLSYAVSFGAHYRL